MATVTWQEETRYFSGKCSMVLIALDIPNNCTVCLWPLPEISGSLDETLADVTLAGTGDVG
jgi:hypothetical protein